MLLSFTLLALFAACKATTVKTRAPKDTLPGARRHHYHFAHKMLPTYFYEDPNGIREVLESDGPLFLTWLWDRLGSRLEESERLSSEGLELIVRNPARDMVVFVVKYPAPEIVPEAYFTALVYHQDRVFYVTLEHSLVLLPGMSGTILGAWNEEGDHLNFGSGPNPTVNAFVKAILDMYLD